MLQTELSFAKCRDVLLSCWVDIWNDWLYPSELDIIMTWYSIFYVDHFVKHLNVYFQDELILAMLIVSQWPWYHFGLIFNIQCLPFFRENPLPWRVLGLRSPGPDLHTGPYHQGASERGGQLHGYGGTDPCEALPRSSTSHQWDCYEAMCRCE